MLLTSCCIQRRHIFNLLFLLIGLNCQEPQRKEVPTKLKFGTATDLKHNMVWGRQMKPKSNTPLYIYILYIYIWARSFGMRVGSNTITMCTCIVCGTPPWALNIGSRLVCLSLCNRVSLGRLAFEVNIVAVHLVGILVLPGPHAN